MPKRELNPAVKASPSRARVRLGRGICREADGSYRVWGMVNGDEFDKRFPSDWTESEVRAWREAKRVSIRTGQPIVGVTDDGPSFLAKSREYLTLVEDMPSYDDRERDIDAWTAAFRHRAFDSITSTMIAKQLAQWAVNGRVDGGPLSPSSLNGRRTAIMHMFTRLRGKSGANPVKDVPAFDEGDDDEVFRAIDYGTIYRLISLVARNSKTRARLRLMAWTGWPHAILMRIAPEDVDARQKRVYIRRRRKGKGMKGRWLPLLPPAWLALEEFIALNCWGEFSQPSMRKSLLLAAEKLNAHRLRLNPKRPPVVVTPYDLRHSFGTLVALIVKDDRALRELLMTNKIRRYTEAATNPRLSEAIRTLATALQTTGALASLKEAIAEAPSSGETSTAGKRPRGAASAA